MFVSRNTLCVLALIAGVAWLPSTAQARDRTLQSQCFAPETLAGIAGEDKVVKGDKRFDGGAAARSADAVPAIAAPLRGAIRRVDLPKGEKLVALTLDLCEQRGEVAGYVGAIFETLRREAVAATVFAGGKWMRSHQARTEQLMTDPLFEIANHSDTHANLRKLDGAALTEQIQGPQRSYEAARERLGATQCAGRVPSGMQSVAPRLSLFRFPFGACNKASLDAVNDAGLLAIQWDVSAGDPDPNQSADEIVSTIVRRVKPGSIIVAHANGRGWHTASALPRLIAKLKALGYAFVTVSELLARGKPVIAESCYDTRPGDTDRYDFLGRLQANARGNVDMFGWLPTVAPSDDAPKKSSRKSPRKASKRATETVIPGQPF
jgi:peptidoglycan-N-acetylglucosamine deacetylase